MEYNENEEVRLPPIKFEVDTHRDVSNRYRNSFALKREIIRVFPCIEGKEERIKKIIFNPGCVKIITDDQDIHREIVATSTVEDAFGKGMKIVNSVTDNWGPKTFQIKILNANPEYDMDNEFLDLISNYYITNPLRIKSRGDGSPTTIIAAEVTDYKTYIDLIKRKTLIKVPFGETLKIVPKYLYKQCFNCLKVGHLKKDCLEETPSCFTCGQRHTSEHCESRGIIQCVNCGLNHSSVSRKCEVLKKAAEDSLNKLLDVPQKRTFLPQKFNHWDQTNQHNYLKNTEIDNTVEVTNKVNELFGKDDFLKSIGDKIFKLIEVKIDELISQNLALLEQKLEDALSKSLSEKINGFIDQKIADATSKIKSSTSTNPPKLINSSQSSNNHSQITATNQAVKPINSSQTRNNNHSQITSTTAPGRNRYSMDNSEPKKPRLTQSNNSYDDY